MAVDGPITTVAIALALAAFASANSLAFLEPLANAPTTLGESIEYDAGQDVEVRWSTDFEYTTLKLYQGPLDDGSYAQDVLAANWTQSNTSLTWKAGAVDNANLTHAFHFELLNGHNTSCENCTANSINFHVSSQVASDSTSSSGSSSTSSTTATSLLTSSTQSSLATPTSTQDAAGAAASAQDNPGSTAASDASNSHRHIAVGFGVGLGVGIPVLLALGGLLAFCLWRRRKNRRASLQLPRGRQMPDMLLIRDRLSDTSLTHPQAPFLQDPASSGRLSAGARSSRSSYFEPFEFERPGSRDFDTLNVMSEMATNGRSVAPRHGLESIHENDPPRLPDWPLPAHGL